MKTLLSFFTLSAKLMILMCVSSMGVMNMSQEVMAEKTSPCGMTMEKEGTKSSSQESCDICEETLDAWEQEVSSTKAITLKTETKVFSLNSASNLFSWDSEFSEKIFHTYSPPPEAALKAVTPITKTTVLIL